ncbi:uncharacterized protein TRIADDRAFT_32527 [Trichoplax adhaerens]|uniref:KAT8 regulatory NSL complex subunit 3 n=1 Tax=Trichoplax adhaerens TaxID=10228 RepID=B3SB39_TRIAD|nr:hypothetical protein TRIADDRAFT_32527 [Trichoplax adhaerens]EDV20096.1 hypothetical protein TRIADDRAFT_32527 [Trichoplax adhaerens]|eukprot:XP_002117480.1 hypothetical protein TRIADDRAFT_32527 [Trichoplax adhaerens]
MAGKNSLSTSKGKREIVADIKVILLDHSYSKSWIPHPGYNSNRPAKSIFVPKFYSHDSRSSSDDVTIDGRVEMNRHLSSSYYDVAKARNVMSECEKHIGLVVAKRAKPLYDDIDDIPRTGWTFRQNQLFDKVSRSINSCRLAKLACETTANEPILRRNCIDKAARNVRQIFALIRWDPKLLLWLHTLLMDNLSTTYLSDYLDILQTLRAKCPSMVDKLIGMYASDCQNPTGSEALQLLLNRKWDPLVGTVNQHKSFLSELNTPLLLLVPNGPTQPSNSTSRRLRAWQSHLSTCGKVVPITMHSTKNVNVSQCLDHMIGAVRTKILELKCHFPKRPIVLAGWCAGAAVACRVAIIESIEGVICLGFPTVGLDGMRGDIEDPVLALTTPTLFVVGTESRASSPDDIEELRQNMSANTSLFIVGGADEQLRLSHQVKRRECVTQTIADKMIQNEIAEFLSRTLTRRGINDENYSNPVTKPNNQRKRKRPSPNLSKDSIKSTPPKTGWY